MEIRAFEKNYKDDVIELWRDCGLLVPQNDPAKDIERKLKVDPDLFLVGLVGEMVVATVMGGYEGHRGCMAALLPAYIRQPRVPNLGGGRQGLSIGKRRW